MSEERNGTEATRPAGDTAEAARVLSLARSLLAKGGTLESTASGESIDRASLSGALRRRAEQNAAAASGGQPHPPSLTAQTVAAETLSAAESALNKTAGGASPSSLTDIEVAALEAIIEVTGRPAMRYVNGKVQMPPEDLGDNDRWRVLIAQARPKINKASGSVGRISFVAPPGLAALAGTGWRVGGDLLVTNRHVVEKLVTDPEATPDAWAIDAAKRPHIDFAADDASPAQRFEIAELVYCAPEEEIDVAFLRVTSGVEALPPPLKLDWDAEAAGSELAGAGGEPPRFRGNEIYVVGHPYRRRGSELTAAIFGQVDGAKRWSPGLVTRVEANKPLLEHDCTTLGGNSGSCVLTAEGHAVIGLHIAGLDVQEWSGRGRTNQALAFAGLGTHRAARLLRGEA
ncbi:MAG TPA: serine protease [Pyrinomonadaceae bacterium]|nr:serine protease [Pyrinomonadaceae bacterium]